MATKKEKIITVKREKLKNDMYRIHELEDGKETDSYVARCKSKFGLIQIDTRGCFNRIETYSCGEGLPHHDSKDWVFCVDAFGRVQGPYKIYYRSTLNGNSEDIRYYKDGIEQPKDFVRPRVNMALKGISSRLQKFFFGRAKEQVNLKEMKSRSGRE